eukprot:989701-Pyramimonas_sp.AAC.1
MSCDKSTSFFPGQDDRILSDLPGFQRGPCSCIQQRSEASLWWDSISCPRIHVLLHVQELGDVPWYCDCTDETFWNLFNQFKIDHRLNHPSSEYIPGPGLFLMGKFTPHDLEIFILGVNRRERETATLFSLASRIVRSGSQTSLPWGGTRHNATLGVRLARRGP